MKKTRHAICVAAANSGSGKTTVALAIISALRKRGVSVRPFKCGPDYIDPGFHTAAAGLPSVNLDSWMMGEGGVEDSFLRNSQDAEFAVVEGVMGLFDGASPRGIDGSTAHVCELLGIPVILVVNAKGMAGSVAPLVKGFCEFRKGVEIVGVVANNVSSERHASILAEALGAGELPPLLGYLERNEKLALPERHLGLVPETEEKKSAKWFAALAEEAEKSFDIGRIMKISVRKKNSLPSILLKSRRVAGVPVEKTKKLVRLGVAWDEAFSFYYQDNLELLEENGFEIVRFSPLKDKEIPKGVSGLYIGGGFPEVFAGGLERNESMRNEMREYALGGGFIWAECGGLMYLGRSITDNDGEKHEMCGVFDGHSVMMKKLHRLGYREMKMICESPFGPKGTSLRGHEFHWSDMKVKRVSSTPFCEIRGARERKWAPAGARLLNTFASYVHIHFLSNPGAVRNLYAHLRQV